MSISTQASFVSEYPESLDITCSSPLPGSDFHAKNDIDNMLFHFFNLCGQIVDSQLLFVTLGRAVIRIDQVSCWLTQSILSVILILG